MRALPKTVYRWSIGCARVSQSWPSTTDMRVVISWGAHKKWHPYLMLRLPWLSGYDIVFYAGWLLGLKGDPYGKRTN